MILAHPAWSVMSPEEMLDLCGFAGAEIFNSISRYSFILGRDEAAYYWDIWRKKGKLVGAFAGDDSHRYAGEQSKDFTMVNTQALQRDAIMDAFKRGNLYVNPIRLGQTDDIKRLMVWVKHRIGSCMRTYMCRSS